MKFKMQELQQVIVEMKFDPLNVVAIVIDLKIGGQNLFGL